MLGTHSIGCLLHVACPRQYKVILFQYLNKPQKQTLSWQMNSSQKFIFLPYEEFSLHMRYLHLLRIWLRYHTPWTLECYLHRIWDCLPLRPSWNQDLSMSSLCPLRPLWSQLLCSENIEYHDKISMKITLIFSKLHSQLPLWNYRGHFELIVAKKFWSAIRPKIWLQLRSFAWQRCETPHWHQCIWKLHTIHWYEMRLQIGCRILQNIVTLRFSTSQHYLCI